MPKPPILLNRVDPSYLSTQVRPLLLRTSYAFLLLMFADIISHSSLFLHLPFLHTSYFTPISLSFSLSFFFSSISLPQSSSLSSHNLGTLCRFDKKIRSANHRAGPGQAIRKVIMFLAEEEVECVTPRQTHFIRFYPVHKSLHSLLPIFIIHHRCTTSSLSVPPSPPELDRLIRIHPILSHPLIKCHHPKLPHTFNTTDPPIHCIPSGVPVSP